MSELFRTQPWRDIMACERANHSSCSVFGCTNEHKSLFPLPSSAPLKNQWVDFIFSINASVCAKHFTDDCFLNLGKYRAGLEPLEIKSGSVPSLLGSATDLGQVSQLIYHCVALLYVVTLLPLLQCCCSISSTANSPFTVSSVKVDCISYVCEYTRSITHCVTRM